MLKYIEILERCFFRNRMILPMAVLTGFFMFFSGYSGAMGKTPVDSNQVITVTGKPAVSSHIRDVVENYFACRGRNAGITSEIPRSLYPGDEKVLNVLLSDDDGKKESCRVKVRNEATAELDCSFLALSNHPERVKGRGIHYEVGLIRHKPVRLRYYHLGWEESKVPFYLGIYVRNDSSEPARLHVIEALGTPSKDYMASGHMNNMKFFSRKADNMGWIEEIPPGTMALLRRVKLNPGEVVSATMDLHLLKGGPLQTYVYASEHKDGDLNVSMVSDEKDPHSRGAYPLTGIYTCGMMSLDEGERIYAIADTPLDSIFHIDRGRANRGGYGVVYEYDLDIRNPYRAEKTLNFYFQPRGGIATATFLFDKVPVSVGYTPAYAMVRLYSVKVPAGGSRRIRVKTMPEDASNYPARLILIPE